MNTLGAEAHSDTPSTSDQITFPLENTRTPQSRPESDAGSIEPPSPRTVRRHFLSSAWERISNARKFFLLSSIVMVIAQLGSIIAALVISRDQTCDRRLDAFLIVFLTRSVANLPLAVYHHLRSAREQGQESARPRREWTDRLKSMLDIFGIVWFIVGNYFLFTSGACAQEAPVLYITTVVWVFLGYLLFLLPLILFVSVIFCLPCVLVMMRILNLGYPSGFALGATQEEINTILVYRYCTQVEPTEGELTGSVHDNGTTQHQVDASSVKHSREKRPFFFKRLLRRSKSQQDLERTHEALTITPIEDAMCSICLSEYEDEDLVCKLWCHHHFHKDCVHEWLLLNSSCPLCKRDFRTKDPEPL